jgi:hypothetical protein
MSKTEKLKMLLAEKKIDKNEPKSIKWMKAHDKKESKTMEKKEKSIEKKVISKKK